MPEWVVNLNSEAELASWVSHLAPLLQPGLVIALDGQLGAGKTHFVSALAGASGIDTDQVNSPTYIILQQYQGAWTFHHFDWYRLKDEDEWAELGAEDLLGGTGISLVEWSSRFPLLLPADHLAITLIPTGENSRECRVRATGPQSRSILEEWTKNYSLHRV